LFQIRDSLLKHKRRDRQHEWQEQSKQDNTLEDLETMELEDKDTVEHTTPIEPIQQIQKPEATQPEAFIMDLEPIEDQEQDTLSKLRGGKP
jgi:hypothetical protein